MIYYSVYFKGDVIVEYYLAEKLEMNLELAEIFKMITVIMEMLCLNRQIICKKRDTALQINRDWHLQIPFEVSPLWVLGFGH